MVSCLALGVAVTDRCPAQERAPEPVQIGLIFDGEHETRGEWEERAIEEIRTLTREELDVRFPAGARLVADWTVPGIQEAIERLLDDPEIDLVIALGVIGSHLLCCIDDLPKPVVAALVVDASLQGFPRREEGSGRRNLSYVGLADPVRRDIEAFLEVVPFDTLAVLAKGALLESVPDLGQRVRAAVRGLGVEPFTVPVGSSVEAALEAIPDRAEAVYVTPLGLGSTADYRRLVDGLIERKLPSFSLWGGREVELGLLASLRDEGLVQRLLRRVALNVQRILLGEDAGSLPVGFDFPDRLRINMATARAIGVSPPFETLIQARLLARDRDGVEAMSLERAIRRSIEANLDLLVRQRFVDAGEQEVHRSRSLRRPQLDVSAVGLLIDSDRAAASLGAQAERTMLGSLGLSQLIYSDPVWANVTVQEQLQLGREQELESLRLDIARAASIAYLNLLRAETLAEIQDNNLELTRSNLELADLRRRIGAANPAEVFRWQSQAASDQKSLVEARAVETATRIALNRLLHRDLEEDLATVEVGIDDPSLLSSREVFERYVSTPRSFRIYRDFLVSEGLDRSPELARLTAGIVAQERLLVSARRSFWLPTIGLEGRLEEVFDEGGEGSSDLGLSLPGLGLAVADDTSWSLGLSATLPLFAGGERAAARSQASLELERLQMQYDAVSEKVEERIRSALVIARSSLTGISLARESAAAAERNLELVQEAYGRGAVSIIDLLDAQNAALNAGLLEANAVYDFLVDLMEVMRASSQLDLFLSPSARDAWLDRLQRHFADAGSMPEPER